MQIFDYPSPNFNDRVGGAPPTHLILHYTDMPLDGALARLCDPQAEVSAHYLIAAEGVIYRLVNEAKRAWHCGKSTWRGKGDLNSHSIGIELDHPGHDGGLPEFLPAQMQALAELCHDILARHKIPPAQILAHSDIAPGRKIDPGEKFDWQWLSAQGIGLWPPSGGAANGDARELLTRYGYDTTTDLKTTLTAFQRHFHPEIFMTPEKIGVPEAETLRRLNALLTLS